MRLIFIGVVTFMVLVRYIPRDSQTCLLSSDKYYWKKKKGKVFKRSRKELTFSDTIAIVRV